ncbi:MAG: helix-turn-helix transcriptional regulator, partial [Aristaeellaceae bacterium]
EQGVLSSFFWRMAMTRYCNEVLYFKAQPDERLRHMVLRIYDEVHLQTRPGSVIQESYVNILLGEMMRRHRGDLVKLQGLDEHVYQIPAILAEMKQHLAEVTPAWLAEQWKMSEEDMLAVLKRETGHSFHYILNDLRMQRAAALLEGTTYSIERIMEEIGVYDATSFYRHFRKRYNMTPQQYRQGRILP